MKSPPRNSSVRIAAVGDLHCTKSSKGQYQGLFAQMSKEADVLALCGDLTDYGLVDEAHVLAQELSAAAPLAVVAVLGNHDYESGKVDEIKALLQAAGVQVLDGDSTEIHGVGFAGVKGFLGGFDQRMLQGWGEHTIKQIVQDTTDEATKLERALARLTAPRRVVLLHYSPIRATVEGEAPEIWPFLGSSRLEEPLHRHPVAAVFHGHSHFGRMEGKTTAGIPVYNVALPLLRRSHPQKPPYRVITLEPRIIHAA